MCTGLLNGNPVCKYSVRENTTFGVLGLVMEGRALGRDNSYVLKWCNGTFLGLSCPNSSWVWYVPRINYNPSATKFRQHTKVSLLWLISVPRTPLTQATFLSDTCTNYQPRCDLSISVEYMACSGLSTSLGKAAEDQLDCAKSSLSFCPWKENGTTDGLTSADAVMVSVQTRLACVSTWHMDLVNNGRRTLKGDSW